MTSPGTAFTRNGSLIAQADSVTHPTVVAIIAAYNEADIIGRVIAHLVDQGVGVYVIDNHSTDATRTVVETFAGRGLIGAETFPPGAVKGDAEGGGIRWQDILARKQALATELEADWFIHHDADEIRESPWANLTLRDAIHLVDRLGYNAIDFEVFNFWPTGGVQTGDLLEGFRYYESGQTFDRLQIKCWKKSDSPADLVPSGGHEADFPGRCVFPIRFVLRHYPIRSPAHGARKVFAERRDRFAQSERDLRWHVQYDRFDPGEGFTRDAASLTVYDPDLIRAQLALRHRDVECLQERLQAQQAEVTRLETGHRQEIGRLRAELEAMKAESERHRHELTQVYASRTWRWTQPLRSLIGRLGGS